MKILLTGGSGYVGLMLSELLSKEGFSLAVFGREDPKEGALPKGCSFVKGDVLDKEAVRKACKGIDAMIHLAALDQEKGRGNLHQSLLVNGIGALAAFDAAAASGVKTFIYFSTFHVYGPLSGMITEETMPAPINEYGVSKLIGELLVKKEGKIRPIILRFSNIYGSPKGAQGWSLVVNDLCRQAATTGKVVLGTRGEQKRNFMSVSDACNAILLFLQDDAISGGVYNVGGEDTLSIKELAMLVIAEAERKGKKRVALEFKKNLKDDCYIPFTYDFSKIKKLGFVPRSQLRKEIKKTLEAAKR